MASFYFAKQKYVFCFISLSIFVLVIIFYVWFYSDYLFDIYSLNDLVKEYEHTNKKIEEEEIAKWRNLYKHPLVLPSILSPSPYDAYKIKKLNSFKKEYNFKNIELKEISKE